jgi:hypothetical protein
LPDFDIGNFFLLGLHLHYITVSISFFITASAAGLRMATVLTLGRF